MSKENDLIPVVSRLESVHRLAWYEDPEPARVKAAGDKLVPKRPMSVPVLPGFNLLDPAVVAKAPNAPSGIEYEEDPTKISEHDACRVAKATTSAKALAAWRGRETRPAVIKVLDERAEEIEHLRGGMV